MQVFEINQNSKNVNEFVIMYHHKIIKKKILNELKTYILFNCI